MSSTFPDNGLEPRAGGASAALAAPTEAVTPGVPRRRFKQHPEDKGCGVERLEQIPAHRRIARL